LKFNHPKTRKAVQLQAALPDELQQFLPSRAAEARPQSSAESDNS
jgi:23S rRNA pseudouridine955/2504/2580 synthase